jgi:hypothetical protein
MLRVSDSPLKNFKARLIFPKKMLSPASWPPIIIRPQPLPLAPGVWRQPENGATAAYFEKFPLGQHAHRHKRFSGFIAGAKAHVCMPKKPVDAIAIESH